MLVKPSPLSTTDDAAPSEHSNRTTYPVNCEKGLLREQVTSDLAYR